MRRHSSLITIFSFISMLAAAAVVQAQGREEGRLLTATQVMQELRGTRDQMIPERLLERAYGIAVLPEVTKVAFIAGGARGRGVLVVRDKDGRFTNPVFISITRGSIGWQAGVQSTDIVLVFTTRTGIEGISDGKLTLGADASVAAGPVGRQASAATDPTFSAEIYSYSRTRGLFAGIALDGTALAIDRYANTNFYGREGANASSIINGAVHSDSEGVKRFLAAVATSTGAESAAGSADAAADSAPPSPPPAGAAPPASGSGAAQTFPMEDPHPGQDLPQQ